jgi:hypothetical protein
MIANFCDCHSNDFIFYFFHFYFAQAALMITHSSTVTNPFYSMVPKSLFWPMLVLSTVATVIASQGSHQNFSKLSSNCAFLISCFVPSQQSSLAHFL